MVLIYLRWVVPRYVPSVSHRPLNQSHGSLNHSLTLYGVFWLCAFRVTADPSTVTQTVRMIKSPSNWVNLHHDNSFVPTLNEGSMIINVGSHLNDSYFSLSDLLSCKLRYLLLDCIFNSYFGADIATSASSHTSSWLLSRATGCLSLIIFILLILVYIVTLLAFRYGPYVT